MQFPNRSKKKKKNFEMEMNWMNVPYGDPPFILRTAASTAVFIAHMGTITEGSCINNDR